MMQPLLQLRKLSKESGIFLLQCREDKMNAQEEEEQPHYQLPAARVGGGDYKILLKPLVID